MSLFFSVMDGHLFGVKATEMIVPAFGDDLTVFDEHAPDQWIRTDVPSTAFGHEKCTLHVGAVVIAPCFVHGQSKRREFKTACIDSSTEIFGKTVFMLSE
jgi:hypothetical protein